MTIWHTKATNMVINLRINPDLRKAEMAAKLMAQQHKNIGAILRSGYNIVEGTISLIDESLEELFKKVRLEVTISGSVVKFI